MLIVQVIVFSGVNLSIIQDRSRSWNRAAANNKRKKFGTIVPLPSDLVLTGCFKCQDQIIYQLFEYAVKRDIS